MESTNPTIKSWDKVNACGNHSYQKEKQDNIGNLMVYIVSLTDDTSLNELFQEYPIQGAAFIKPCCWESLSCLHSADFVFVLGSHKAKKGLLKKVTNKIHKKAIKALFSPPNSSVPLNLFHTCADLKILGYETYASIKNFAETTALPSLVGLDFDDVKSLFLQNKKMVCKSYSSNLGEKKTIVNEIKKDFKKLDGCFFVVIGPPAITLYDINWFGEQMTKFVDNTVWGARVDDQMGNMVELYVYGFRK